MAAALGAYLSNLILLRSELALGDFFIESWASLALTPWSIDKSPQLSLSKLDDMSLGFLVMICYLNSGDFA